MKKIIIIFFILLGVFNLFCYAQKTEIPPPRIRNITATFRGTKWGMSSEQVKSLEKAKLVKSDHINNLGLDVLIYSDSVGGLDCGIIYYFAENKLVEGRYIFMSEHSNKNLYIQDFKDINEAIKGKYGKPKEDKKTWLDSLYEDDLENWGLAVSIGHLIFQTKWSFQDSEILHILKGDNFKITHMVAYLSTKKEYQELREKAEEKAKSKIW